VGGTGKGDVPICSNWQEHYAYECNRNDVGRFNDQETVATLAGASNVRNVHEPDIDGKVNLTLAKMKGYIREGT
jgi:hypothetical protein